ncbi:MAG: cell shape-determining protein, partial [Acidobacteria bacterium]|nr:cell shape-determining protein [Acidobacteriota bacterium]
VFSPGPGGGTSNTKVFNIQNMSNQPPSTGLLAPDSVAAGTIRDTLTVQVMGSNFVMGSVVRWNGSNRLTTFVSGDRVDATIPASDLLSAGMALVTVFTPAPGGGTSNFQTFTINNPPPTLAAISPSSATAGDLGFTLVVTGSKFVPGSIVRWNGSNRPTNFIGNSQLRAEIPASDLVTAGNASVTVFTPAPGGGTSDSQSFTINAAVVASSPEEEAPPPDTTAAEPTEPASEPEGVGGSVPAAGEGGGDPAEADSEPGIRDVKQAALVGATMGRTVASEIPVLEAVESETAAAGNGKFILKVRGKNFLPGAVVRWNGRHLRTTFSDREQLRAEIPARLAATPGIVRITVVNPGPANAVSQPLEFAVR